MLLYIYTCIGQGFLRTKKSSHSCDLLSGDHWFWGSNSLIWSAIREKATYMGDHRIGF